MWRELRDELHPRGLEVVTVALDTGGADAARPWIERAEPTHPSLVDSAHALDELFGVWNVPMGIWIDEEGVLARPPEPAFPRRVSYDRPIPEDLPDRLREMLEEARKIRYEPEKYTSALRDWVEKGADSRFALSPDEVVERSRPRPWEHALAAAHFELAQRLHTTGHKRDAVTHFRQAHRLDPENWTYKRQAWSFADPFQGPSDDYDGDWLTEVRKTGAENYYPALRMD